MKKFLKKIVFFTIPIYLYTGLVIFTDPYNYLGTGFVKEKIKKETSYKLNYPLYELIEYDVKKQNYILLGDSRVENLGLDLFQEIFGKEFANLAYGGGTLEESISTFWEVAKNNETLKEVYFGINFDSYNGGINMNRVNDAINIKSSFLKYAFSKYTVRSVFLILSKTIFNNKKQLGQVKKTREEFWNYQLNSSANNFFRSYKYPEQKFNKLKKISEYCNKNNIKLTFFIPPNHNDLDEKVKEYNLEKFALRFKKDLSSLGVVYDFNNEDFKLRYEKSNFLDPFHIKKEKSIFIISDLKSKNPKSAKILKK